MCSKYNLAPPVFLIRHPCAVVASQMNYGWLGQRRPIVPAYIEKFPMFKRAIAELERPEEYLAAEWVLDQLPALFQPQPHPWTIVTYEELLLNPEPTVSRITKSWNLEIDMPRAMSRLKRPSTTVSKSGIRGIGGWKNDLSNLQVSMILDTIRKFGIRFYGEDAEADYLCCKAIAWLPTFVALAWWAITTRRFLHVAPRLKLTPTAPSWTYRGGSGGAG